MQFRSLHLVSEIELGSHPVQIATTCTDNINDKHLKIHLEIVESFSSKGLMVDSTSRGLGTTNRCQITHGVGLTDVYHYAVPTVLSFFP